MVSKSKQMKKILNTKTVHAAKRTYFVNQGTLNKEPIIEITESKHITPGKYKRTTILIYKEDIDLVMEALQQIDKESK